MGYKYTWVNKDLVNKVNKTHLGTNETNERELKKELQRTTKPNTGTEYKQ